MPDGDRREFDRPAERLAAFYRWVSTAPQVFSGVLEASIRHANQAPADPGAERWTPLGPRNVGGAVRSIAQDPRTPTTLYAGTAQGGLWKSEDDGYTWRPLGGPELMLPIGSVAVAPSNPRVLYLGTGEQAYGTVAGRGFYKSSDGGDGFERLAGSSAAGGSGATDHYAQIQVDPFDPDRCWAASDTGLWRFEGSRVTAEALPGVAPGAAVTDVVLARDPANANEYVLLAGAQAVGVFRGVFNRRNRTIAWNAVAGFPAAGAGYGRIRLAFSRTLVGIAPTPFAYAIMDDQGLSGAAVQGFPTVVYQSTDFGRTWAPPLGAVSPAPPPAAGQPGQAWYSLSLAVDPANPNRVIAGYVDVHLSVDGGRTWSTILDWRLYDNGDRAQHADQHSIHFNFRNPRQLWVCNDGGISLTPDVTTTFPPPPTGAGWFGPAPTPKPVWRKKSYGIIAAQFTDITTHPRYPFILGGGMQDNGTFVSYGGPTWYRLFGADGGQLAFDPNNPRQFWPTWQGGLETVQLIAAGAPPHPQDSALLPDQDPPGNVMVPQRVWPPPLAFPGGNGPPWIGVIEGHPTSSNFLLMGRQGGGFYTTDAASVVGLNTPGMAGDVSALALAGGAPDMWLGTTTGQVFTTTSALPPSTPPPPPPGPAWTLRPLPAAAGGAAIAGIAIHPLNANVVAVSTWGTPGRAFLTHDKGVNWREITGAAQALPACPISGVAFDPTNAQVLFAGTLAGVYVIRNLPAPGGAPAAVPAFDPAWMTFNLGLPLVQVNDLSVVPLANTLRCATYGRGAFEVNISGATPPQHRIPGVKLSIREHAADDGRTYPPANLFFDDPRLPAVVPAPADFNHTRAIDIRVDAPSFIRSEAFAFGESIDGAEFDETLVSDKPLVGDTNFLYVQVQNRGAQPANNVKVYVYYADAGNPPVPPPLDAAMNYPGEPAPASTWQLAAPVETVGFVHPGQPAVVRFEWTPPLEIKDNVALLALCSNAEDSVAALPGGTAVVDFVKGERRAALRVVGVNRDAIYIRDGIDDDGSRGAVAWGGRSPDIIVVQTAVADPDDPAGPFKDLQDPRFGDRVHPGNNFIYVRILNRTEVAVNANVRVFQVPTANPVPGTSWTPVGGPAAVAAIPPKGWKFASIPWAGVTDPDPANPDYKAFTLMAVANVTDGAGIELDPFPDLATVTDLDNFWRFFLSAPLANNAAMRGLRFVAP